MCVCDGVFKDNPTIDFYSHETPYGWQARARVMREAGDASAELQLELRHDVTLPLAALSGLVV